MIVKPILPSPSIDQIDELRTAFFAKLEKEGAPCSGNFSSKHLRQNSNSDHNNINMCVCVHDE